LEDLRNLQEQWTNSLLDTLVTVLSWAGNLGAVWLIPLGGMDVSAALETGLPVWLGFSCTRDEDGELALWQGGERLSEAVPELTSLGVSLVSVMHTLTENTPDALQEIKAHWQGPLGAYPHSGRFVMPNWQFEGVITPEDFVAEAHRWRELGAIAIGGCCGIGPEHIKLLKRKMQ
jgi:S-methylmethionine-dependent homocysteine/selenocysteine methylase